MRKEKKNEVKYNIETNKQNSLEVNETQSVYLTKDKKLLEKLAIEEEMERRFGCDDIEKALDEADEDAENNKVRYTHDEIFNEARRIISAK